MPTNDNEQSYRRLSDAVVASSDQLADDVVADFNAAGEVVGIEFLSYQAARRAEHWIAMARSRAAGWTTAS